MLRRYLLLMTSYARRLFNVGPYPSGKDMYVCVNRTHTTAGIPNTMTLAHPEGRYLQMLPDQRGVVQNKSICGPAASIEDAEPHYTYPTSLR